MIIVSDRVYEHMAATNLTLKTKVLKDDSVKKCIIRTHGLHEQISGSIVRMNMFCIL